MARNNVGLLLMLGLGYLFLSRKKKTTNGLYVFDPRPEFTRYVTTVLEGAEDPSTETYVAPPPTVSYPEQRAVLLLRQEERALRARSITPSVRTKVERKGIRYGRGEIAYKPKVPAKTYQEERALILLDRM